MANQNNAEIIQEKLHPMEDILRMDRMPHIWCSGCGLGSAVTTFAEGLNKAGISYDKTAIVSGIGCTGRVAGYLRLDSYHTTHGRAIPFATGLKLANRDLTVVVFSGDGDLFAIGGNHLIHAARRNVDINVICVNNFIYGMTGGQNAPTTPLGAYSSTAPFGNYEMPFNLVGVAAASGAAYVARWTTMHARRLTDSIAEAAKKKGFCFIEIVSPCATVFARKNRGGTGLDLLKEFGSRSVIDHKADPTKIPLEMNNDIVCGVFVNDDKPTFWENVQAGIKSQVEKYSNWEELQSNSKKTHYKKIHKYTASRDS
ncbi:MAG TPA: 2-oxoacid:ferredoxin oxidoreductase subunit beta [Candidatus Cloacimonetes bacterium]|nr:2-oxoacid:ferredoxin oxidoreductase subunit beta [Candidatus Cloacimonadota bacterium]